MSMKQRIAEFFGVRQPAADDRLPGEQPRAHTEVGNRTTPEEELELMHLRMEPDFRLRGTIQDIRDMDQRDARVKKVHDRTSRAATKGGLSIEIDPKARRVINLWAEFERRLVLNRQEKLESDMRGLMMEGNLPMQWVLDTDQTAVVSGVRMPTETIRPRVTPAGRFEDILAAYEQWDWVQAKSLVIFPLWQLNLVRLRPDNYDNWGSMGRPYLDATRTTWRQLVMTEKDLVVRRHMRAPQKYSHILEGASETELGAYENRMKNKLGNITTDFFSNRKGGVTAVQGDANLDQIADVAHLLDTFFAGAPAPKGLFGYVGDLNRDILEDLKRDYYDELDALQDTASFGYELGFRLQLLLAGINPDAIPFEIKFTERRTETPNQRADLALKHQALGVPPMMNFRTAGLDPNTVKEYLQAARSEVDPYPLPQRIAGAGGAPRVSITPGNQRQQESGTAISNR